MTPISHLLSTGNLVSSSGLDLSQVTGYSVLADRLNYLRHMAHYRSVHRGAFFTEMKTTEVRKLLGGGWGFLCPVHTPDGGPCGLLVHLSQGAEIVTPRPQECFQWSGGGKGATLKEKRGGGGGVRGMSYLRYFWENDLVKAGSEDHNGVVDCAGDEETAIGVNFVKALLGKFPAQKKSRKNKNKNKNKSSSSQPQPQPQPQPREQEPNPKNFATVPYSLPAMKAYLTALGIVPVTPSSNPILPSDEYYPVTIDGVVAGYGTRSVLKSIVKSLRREKVRGLKFERDSAYDEREEGDEEDKGQRPNFVIPVTTEVAYIPPGEEGSEASDTTSPFPGLFLFADIGPGGMGRVVRPVWFDGGSKRSKKSKTRNNADPGEGIELIGGLEQSFLTVSITSAEKPPKDAYHNELSPTFMLSVLASATPFSDYNQSPRNMYQCQMAKQTMGTAVHNWDGRADNKMYRIMSPQRPVVSTKGHRGELSDGHCSELELMFN